MFRLLVTAAAVIGAPVAAQTVSPLSRPQDVDTSGFATKAEMRTVEAEMPRPAATAPLAEATVADVGTNPNVYALANHKHPRITQSPVVVTVAGGTFAGTFPPGFFAAPPTISLTWEGGSVFPVTCQLATGSVTTTAFSGKCWSLAVGSILAAGAGTAVHVVALPRQ